MGYLPVQTALEGTADASADAAVPTKDATPEPETPAQEIQVHSATAASAVPECRQDLTPDSEDEHHLIAQYCRSLNGDNGSSAASTVPRSPVQLLAALDVNHKEEIETMIRELEEENANLQAEYERLRSQQSPSMSMSLSSSPDDIVQQVSDVERDMLAEARLLRQHKTRLEARMKILEEHNRQLEAQLARLRQLLDEPPAATSGATASAASPAKTGTLQMRSVTASHLATDTPVRSNGHDSAPLWNEAIDRFESRPPPPPMGQAANSQNLGNLLHMAGTWCLDWQIISCLFNVFNCLIEQETWER